MLDDTYFMKQALIEAGKAAERGEVPVGAVVVCKERIIARAHNLTETLNDVTAHAEMQAITAAANVLGGKYLSECILYVTVEPCVMCAGAAVNARISRIVFGAYDKRFGCCGTVYNLACDQKFNHRCEVSGGIMEQECLEEVQNFFKKLRKSKKNESERLNS